MYTVLPYSEFVGGGIKTSKDMDQLTRALKSMMTKKSSMKRSSTTASRQSSISSLTNIDPIRRSSRIEGVVQKKEYEHVLQSLEGFGIGKAKPIEPVKQKKTINPPVVTGHYDTESIEAALTEGFEFDIEFVKSLLHDIEYSETSMYLSTENIANGSIFKNKDTINFLVDIVMFDYLWKSYFNDDEIIRYQKTYRSALTSFYNRVLLDKKGKGEYKIRDIANNFINKNTISNGKMYGILEFVKYINEKTRENGKTPLNRMVPNNVIHKDVLFLIEKIMEKQALWKMDRNIMEA